MSEAAEEFLPGIAFIINQSFNRPFSKQDVNLLTRTFQPFNITVVNWSDKNLNEIKQSMKALKKDWKEKYNHFEYVIMVHLSHGHCDETVLYQTENAEVHELVSIQKLLLNPLFKIEELNGKLKWLIVQACKGNDEFADAKTEGGTISLARQKYFTDYFLKSFSTSEGGVSRRFYLTGAYFINRFCEQFTANAERKGVLEIMEDTGAELRNYLRKDLTETLQLQQPAENHRNFPGDFYLARRLSHKNFQI
ncbi:uncharacterized protein LOC119672811 [Teleopsis dalmanni]|uniref:uncharacterized protein LOC119672811 n=1 Tax=Teleopsis dalmanni TaxID=139649 RepID=UPI0018CF7EB2|nr:uncharacterized protein LOC119672811 [Teleopsis dalmanni]